MQWPFGELTFLVVLLSSVASPESQPWLNEGERSVAKRSINGGKAGDLSPGLSNNVSDPTEPNHPERKAGDGELQVKKAKKHHAILGHHPKKSLYGRHVCSEEQVVSKPTKITESYCKPIYKSFTQKCSDGLCTAFRVQYETLYRTVVKTQTSVEKKLVCCPGWTIPQSNPHTCTQAICQNPCQNGASCTKPEVCMCAPGYTGTRCEKDFDECATTAGNGCHHLCVNAPGSYTCACHDGFEILPDGMNCRLKVDSIPEFLALRKSYEEIAEKIKNVESQPKVANLEESTTAEAKTQTTQIHFDPEIKVEIGRLASVLDVVSSRLTKLESEIEQGQGPSEDRLMSLSEQVAILEERLADCSCTNTHGKR